MQEQELLALPRAQINAVDIALPADLEAAISIRWSNDAGYTRLAPIVRFRRPGRREPRLVPFSKTAPIDPFKGRTLDIDAVVLFRSYFQEGVSSPVAAEPFGALQRLANEVYTPLASLELRFQRSDTIWVELTIGKWEGLERDTVCLYHLVMDL